MSSFYSDLMTHRYHLVKFIFAEHQRTLLFVLITCVTIFSMLLTSYSIYLSYLFYDPTTTTSGNKNNNNGGGNSSVLNWIGLAVVGICLMTTCIIGLRGTHIVNLDLLLTFFWGVMIFIGPFILAIVVGFDFFLFLSIYFDHGWNTSTFRGIREIFCHPSSYADTLCAVPYQYATNRASVNSWCLTNYNSTDCYDTYNQAFNNSLRTASSLILIQTIISVINLGILLVTIFIVFRMLTSPVIAESMNDVVNYLLVLPIGAGFGMTWYLWNWQSLSGVPYSWSPVM